MSNTAAAGLGFILGFMITISLIGGMLDHANRVLSHDLKQLDIVLAKCKQDSIILYRDSLDNEETRKKTISFFVYFQYICTF